MTFWIWTWSLCLILALSAFAVISVLVTVGGAFDIKRMVHRLRDMQSDKPQRGKPDV